MDVMSSDIQMMNMINCVVRIHRLDLPLDVVVKVPLWDEEIWEEPASSRKQGRSLWSSGLHEPVQEAEKMDVTSSDIQMMNMINCVVRIHRLDLPLDVVVKVPLWDEEIWEEPASSRKQGRSLWSSGLHEPVQEAEKENLGEALDWMTPFPSSSGSPVNKVDGSEPVTEEVLTGSEKQRRRWNVLNRGTEKSVTIRDGGSRSCIVSGCTARVVHLPRHLRRVHQWSPQQALDATKKPSAATPGRRTKTCIVDGCTAVVAHMPRHLREVHHLGPFEIRRAIFGSKKPHPLTSRRGKKRCPLEGCGRVRRNIYQHMRKFHGLEKGRRGWSTMLKWNVSGNESGELYPTTSSTWRSVEEGSKQEEPPEQEMKASNNQRHLCGNIRNNGEIKPCGRGTKSCIVSGCTAVVIHLPRHLRQVHQWSPQQARDAVHSLRKPWSPTSRPSKMCPVEGCGRMTQRIPQHLRKYHKLHVGSLKRHNIKKSQVELEDQDGSIHGPEVVESSIINSSELLDDESGELLLPYPTTISTCEEEELQGEEPPQEETVLPNDQSPCCSITEKATENGEIKPCGRGTKSCIVSGCTAVVIHLPRHLRQVHQWSPQEARYAVHSVAKTLSPTSRPLQKCPVEGCSRMTQRIPQHLRQYHKLQIGSLAQHNIQRAQVELEGQDGSIHGPEVVESSIVSSSELSNDESGELPQPYPTTTSTCEEEGLQGEEPPQEETVLPNDQRSPCYSITGKATENGEIKAYGRGTKSCIISGCTAVVIHLPRHLRQVHQWSPQEARDAVHSLRKPWSPKSRPSKMCPVEGCGRMTQRIPQHLRKYHKLHIGSLKRHNIKKSQVESEGQDGSIHGLEVVESSIRTSSELLDDESGELPLPYPTTTSTCEEEELQGEEPPQEETVLPNDQRSPCCSITDKATENGEIKACGRGTKSCIVSGCTAVVIHLPRHLRQVHQWSHQEARDAVHSLRKPWSPTSRPLKMCPVEGCCRMTQRIPQHLRQYHKLHIGSQDRSDIQVADDDAC